MSKNANDFRSRLSCTQELRRSNLVANAHSTASVHTGVKRFSSMPCCLHWPEFPSSFDLHQLVQSRVQTSSDERLRSDSNMMRMSLYICSQSATKLSQPDPSGEECRRRGVTSKAQELICGHEQAEFRACSLPAGPVRRHRVQQRAVTIEYKAVYALRQQRVHGHNRSGWMLRSACASSAVCFGIFNCHIEATGLLMSLGPIFCRMLWLTPLPGWHLYQCL